MVGVSLTEQEEFPLDQGGPFSTGMAQISQRKWAILLFSLLGAAAGWGVSVGSRDVYSSTSLLLVAPYNLTVLDYKPASLSLSGDAVVLDTQVQYLRSSDNVERVVDRLVETAPDFRPDPENPDARQALRDFVESNLTVRRASVADIIEVTFTAADPELAAFVANEVVDEHLSTQRDQKLLELQQIRERVEERVQVLGDQAAATNRAAIAARNGIGIASIEDQAALDRATTSLERSLIALDEVLTGSEIGAVLATVAETRTALSDVLSELNGMSQENAQIESGVQGDVADPASLEREAEVRANVHRQMLQRHLEIQELANFVTDDARIVSRATPSTISRRLPPELVAAMGFLSCLLLGSLIALSLRSPSQSSPTELKFHR